MHPSVRLHRIFHKGLSSLFFIGLIPYIMMKNKAIVSLAAGFAMVASTALAMPAFAQVGTNTNAGSAPGSGQQGQGHPGMNRGSRVPGGIRPGVFGKVTAINGTSITLSGRQGFGSTTPSVTYTVDASNATVKKDGATSTVSAIAVGDTIAVQGTVTGSNVAAVSIFDGVMGRMGYDGKGGPGAGRPGTASSTPVLGNGQPVIAGTVSAVSGSSLTLTTSSGVTYAVDASAAKVLAGADTIALSNVAVGNKVLVQGAVNGTSITASTVIDQSVRANAAPNQGTHVQGQSHGFLGGIGQFFMHLFGF